MTTPEGNPADLAEQSAGAAGDDATPTAPDVPLDAPEADVLEQAAVVELDEEEYR